MIYTPIDLAGAMRRTFRALRPSQLIIVDGGLWPNQLWDGSKRRKSPTALVNARMSPRSERSFPQVQDARPPPCLACSIWSRCRKKTTSNAGARWACRTESLRHTGSIKFDDAAAAVKPSVQ